MLESAKYSIPSVFQDLKDDQVRGDVFSTLVHLDDVINDVFDHISKRLTEEKDRRISNCRAKIDSIRGQTDRAITVLSTAKYPAPKTLPNVKTLFNDRAFADTPPLDEDPEDDDPNHGPMSATTNAEVVDLFTKVNLYQERAKVEETMHKEGLGRLPSYIPSVSSVLLFNADTNPYQEYTTLDNLLGEDRKEEVDEEAKLAVAPTTLIDGDILPEVGAIDFGYKPKMKELENFNLPSNLALPNIADMQWSASADDEGMKAIAPSVFVESTLPSLPAIEAAPAPTSSGPPPAAPASHPAQQQQAAPPPPPPRAAAPPPPAAPQQAAPPAAQPAPAAAKPPAAVVAKVVPKNAPPPDDARGGLMAALRMGKKLKKASAAPKKAPKPLVKKDEPLTLAEEMKLRMARRAAALSGKKDQAEQKQERRMTMKPVVAKAVSQDGDGDGDGAGEVNMLTELRKKAALKKTPGPAPAAPDDRKKSGAVGGFDPDNMRGLQALVESRAGPGDSGSGSDSSDDDWE